ncbi:hypothetical protein PC123_g6256 [Phytophthora cactorum]|nr:hypothetical protein PC123_g6256 [Phytophthora cactorum]
MEDVPEMVRAYEAQNGVQGVTTFITTFKLNAEITQLNKYTHSRVPGDVSLGETLRQCEHAVTKELRTEYSPP